MCLIIKTINTNKNKGKTKFMSPLNRPLRKRERRLIPPPASDVDRPKVPIIIPPNQTMENRIESFDNTIIDHSMREIGLDIDSTHINALKEELLEQNVFTELNEVLEDGIENVLEKTNTKQKNIVPNYEELRKRKYDQEVSDYMAAGEKFNESELSSNAATAFGCAVLSELLSKKSIIAAIRQFERIKVKVSPNLTILQSSIFSLLNNLFDAFEHRNYSGFMRQVEKLKYVETFSADDQGLMATATNYLTNMTF